MNLAVMEQPASRHGKHPLDHIVDESSAETQETPREPLIDRMMAIARAYVNEAGLYNAMLRVRDDAILLINAPLVGEVAICGIEHGQIIRYF